MGVFAGSARRLSFLPFSRSQSARSAAIHPLGFGQHADVGPRLAMIQRLDQQGWPNKPDAGWIDYDVEVNDGR